MTVWQQDLLRNYRTEQNNWILPLHADGFDYK